MDSDWVASPLFFQPVKQFDGISTITGIVAKIMVAINQLDGIVGLVPNQRYRFIYAPDPNEAIWRGSYIIQPNFHCPSPQKLSAA